MSWFRKRKPPEWTPFERGDQLAFVDAVKRGLASAGLEITDEALEAGVVELPDGTRWDLARLADACVDRERGTWPQVASDDFARARGKADARPLTRLRLQVVSRETMPFARLQLGAVITRPIVGPLLEIAMWDVAGDAEHTAARGEPSLGGLDDAAVLQRARVQAVAAMADDLRVQAVRVAGAHAEIFVSNGYYLGACMLDALARRDCVVAPVSWHHWIVHPVSEETDAAVVAAIADLAQTILAKAPLTFGEGLGTRLYRWRADGPPEPLYQSATTGQ